MRFRTLIYGCLLLFAAAVAQLPAPAQSADDGKVHLDVVVTPKSGEPVADLQQQDFTVFDNKAPRPIESFQAISGDRAAVEVILLIDAVNTSYQVIAYEREQIDKFLRANDGHLAHPTALAVFTDTGTEIQPGFTRDGNALVSDLDKHVIGLRAIRNSAGLFGAGDRVQKSITTVEELISREGPRPGRKIILWVSPGWPLLTGPAIQQTGKQQEQVFSEIMGLSTALRRARITLYSVNPLGAADVGTNSYYYQEFLKGVSKASQVQNADLSLQVLATQSGGLVLFGSNDISGMLQKCFDDLGAYYELTFAPAPGERGTEYHQIEVKVAKPGLTVRTRSGYYSKR